jgi:2-keto-3-deoxy-L-fuconate dehydrogenase
MAGRLEGKTVVITSAGQGIGRATAVAMEAEGATVWATDINEKLLVELAKAHPAIKTLVLDVLKQDQIDAAAKTIGTPDILFNCSGFVHAGSIMEVNDKDWDFAFDLNVRAHYRMMRAFTPGWLERGRGVVVNMSSLASSIKGVPNRFLYGATKAAVIGMTKAMAADYVTKGIRVNAVCPGTVETPSLYDRMRAQGDFEKAKAAFIARQPMGRLAQPEEIASLVIYLASDESAFVTGQTFLIDGGWSV